MQNSKIIKCQNCQKEFVIEPDDFAFYEKIKVPLPTWCPECRLIRRMCFRNERSLYKRKCDLCKKDFISVHSSKKPFPVYCQRCYYSDDWDAMVYGIDYDFNVLFLKQVKKLSPIVPKLGINSVRSVNSDYTNYGIANKNCYLSVSVWENENVFYTNRAHQDKDVVDCYNVFCSSLCHQCIDCQRCYNLIYGQQCESCIDSIFLFNCRNCNNCIACSSLRSQKFQFLNKPITKEEFNNLQEKIREDKKFRAELFNKFLELKNTIPHKFANLLRIKDSFGDSLVNCKRCRDCFEIQDSEDCRYTIIGSKLKDEYDVLYDDISELIYETMSGQESYHCCFNTRAWWNRNVFYSQDIENCNNVFGCVGLRHKQYCILNKQYTKEEYEKLVPKIIEHMNSMPYVDKRGRVYKYGEFFPPELSPFAYNETIAREYFPLTKEQAIEQGYKWKDPEERDIKIDIKSEDLPDHIKDVKDDIIGKIIECAHANPRQSVSTCNEHPTPEQARCGASCTTAFKLIPDELQFYRRMNLPLPRLCPNCRHYQRLKQRNPLKLWHRKCMCGGPTSANGVFKNTVEHSHGNNPCPNEFETTYAPDRKEIVYCEECYLAEVL